MYKRFFHTKVIIIHCGIQVKDNLKKELKVFFYIFMFLMLLMLYFIIKIEFQSKKGSDQDQA